MTSAEAGLSLPYITRSLPTTHHLSPWVPGIPWELEVHVPGVTRFHLVHGGLLSSSSSPSQHLGLYFCTTVLLPSPPTSGFGRHSGQHLLAQDGDVRWPNTSMSAEHKEKMFNGKYWKPLNLILANSTTSLSSTFSKKNTNMAGLPILFFWLTFTWRWVCGNEEWTNIERPG